MIELRDYQKQLIDDARDALRSHRNVLLQSACGSGKTALSVYMMGEAARAGIRSMFVVHQNELLQQTSKALWKQKLEHGVIASGRRVSRMPVQVASVQTLVNRLDKYQEPGLIVIDEAHRSTNTSYYRVLEAYPKARVVGLTATPQRTDGRGLNELYSGLVTGPSIRQLIDAGYLSDYEIFAPPSVADVTGVQTRGGDYAQGELADAMDKPTITGDAVSHYKRLALGKRCVVMCANVKHAESVAEQYRRCSIPSETMHGGMTDRERNAALERFRRGETLVLTNAQLLIEGVDVPAIEVVQWLRPTQSLIVWMQGNGRGLRPAPGKDQLLILDHVGNVHKHGLPDQEREWSLQGTKDKGKSKQQEPEINIQQCPKCFHVFLPGPERCPKCGAVLPTKKKAEMQVVDGHLERIEIKTKAQEQAERKQRRREQGQSRTIEGLVRLGVARQFRNPSAWAVITYYKRQGQKPPRAEFGRAKKLQRRIENGE